MRLTLKRIANRKDYCIGKLYINGKYFCDTLEDVDRGLDDSMTEDDIKQLKVKGQTAIPVGIYTVLLTYSPKYKKIMPLINNVKGYSGIRIHSGNSSKDTEGCLLVGKNTVVGRLTDSRNTYNALFKRLQQKGSNKITIEIYRTYTV
jgi:hypothetical protein